MCTKIHTVEVLITNMFDLCIPIGTYGNNDLLNRLSKTNLEDRDFLILVKWKH